MTFHELVQYFRSQSNAARAIGIKPPSVHAWKEKGIPYDKQCQIEILTGGALKADRPQQEARQ